MATALPSILHSPGPGAVVGLHCGTDGEPDNRWPIENWKTLAELLVRIHSDLHMILLGSAHDQASSDTIEDRLTPGWCTNLVEKTNLVESAGSLSICDLVIGTESAGMLWKCLSAAYMALEI